MNIIKKYMLITVGIVIQLFIVLLIKPRSLTEFLMTCVLIYIMLGLYEMNDTLRQWSQYKDLGHLQSRRAYNKASSMVEEECIWKEDEGNRKHTGKQFFILALINISLLVGIYLFT